jgi:DHA1 family bicyclomycin/chloramphenicol resistance-like MFS transporter
MLVTGLAPILAPLVGGQLLAVSSWEGIFISLSILSALIAILVAVGLKETLPPERRSPSGLRRTLQVMGTLLRDRSFLGHALAGGLTFGALFAYISGSPFVLQEVYGASPQTFSLVFALNSFGLTITAQIGGRLAGRRMTPERLILVGLFLNAIGAVALLATALFDLPLWVLIAALFVMMCGAGFVLPGSGALALAGQPQQIAGSASALTGVLQFAIGAVAAPRVGIGGGGSVLPMALVLAGFTLAAVIAFVGLRRSPRGVSAG